VNSALETYVSATEKSPDLKDIRFQSWTGSSTRTADGTFSGTFTITFTGKCVDACVPPPPVENVAGSAESIHRTATESKTADSDVPATSLSPSPLLASLNTTATSPPKAVSVPAPSSPPSYAPLTGSPLNSSPLFSIAEQDSSPQSQNVDGSWVAAGHTRTKSVPRSGSLTSGFPTGGSNPVARAKPKISSAGNTLF